MARPRYYKGEAIPKDVPVYSSGVPFDISGITSAEFSVMVNKVEQIRFAMPSKEGCQDAIAGGQSHEYRLNIQTDDTWPEGLIEIKAVALIPDGTNYPGGRPDIGMIEVGELW